MYLFHKNDSFQSTVDGVTVTAFVNAVGLTIHEKNHESEKTKGTKAQRDWLLQNVAPVVYERHSTLRKHASIVAGCTEILRFIYQTEIIDYDWYPQNPLERCRLDSFFQWHSLHKDAQGLLSSQQHIEAVESIFLHRINPFIGDFATCSIADVVAFGAIMPVWSEYLKKQESMDRFPKLARWAAKVSEHEEIVNAVAELKLPVAKM